MDEVEKLAQELADWSARVDDYEHVVLKGAVKTHWIHLARFVLRREIEARLEEHNLTCKICKRPAMYNSGGTYCDRLAELRREFW